MLREVIASRDIITEFHTPEFLSQYFYSVGQIPAYILAGDVDRWHLFIYAAETLRLDPDSRDIHIDELRREQGGRKHKTWAPGETQEELDGVVWGGLDEPEDIRVQMEKKQRETIQANAARAKGVPVDYELNKQAVDDAYTAKWVMAEKRASQPRESWEGKCDFEFEEMIKYCYGWLRDIGEVPKPYPLGSLDLFWQRPTPGQVKMDEKTVARRTYITGRVMQFWQKSLSQEGMREQLELGRSPISYRVTLAAKRLNKVIELYAGNWEPDPIHGSDEEVQKTVKKAALKYLNAHFPIETTGAKPGPIQTLDPGYVDYVRLCKKYNIKEGTLLHKADL